MRSRIEKSNGCKREIEDENWNRKPTNRLSAMAAERPTLSLSLYKSNSVCIIFFFSLIWIDSFCLLKREFNTERQLIQRKDIKERKNYKYNIRIKRKRGLFKRKIAPLLAKGWGNREGEREFQSIRIPFLDIDYKNCILYSKVINDEKFIN